MKKITQYIKGLSKRRVAGWCFMALYFLQQLEIDPVIYQTSDKNITLGLLLATIPALLLSKDAKENFVNKRKIQ